MPVSTECAAALLSFRYPSLKKLFIEIHETEKELKNVSTSGIQTIERMKVNFDLIYYINTEPCNECRYIKKQKFSPVKDFKRRFLAFCK